MRRWKVRTLVPLAVLLLSLVAGQAVAAPSDGPLLGLFGHVTAIDPVGADHVVLTLDTREGSKEVEVTTETQLRVPAAETAFVDDLAVGQFLAVVARDTDGRLVAAKVLVKPAEPVVHRHLVGVVTNREDHQLTLVNAQGATLTVDLPIGLEALAPGQVVTAIVKRDPSTRSLLAQDVRSTQQMLGQLKKRLEQAQAEKRARLVEHLKTVIGTAATRHLSILAEVAQRVPPQAQPVLQQVLATQKQRYQQTLQALGLPPPAMEVSGVIGEKNSGEGSILIRFYPLVKGDSIYLTVTDATEITIYGKAGTFDDLEIGQRVTVQYDISSFEARVVKVVKKELKGEQLKALLDTVVRGEVQGRVVQIDTAATPPTVVIALAKGDKLTLAVSPDTGIFVSDQEATLAVLPLNAAVKVRYNPDTGEALDITTVATIAGQSHISGVVSELRKHRLMTVASPDGESITVLIDEHTPIWRDGLRVTNAMVQVGDLVTTARYNLQTGKVQVLLLRSPESVQMKGTIVGKVTTTEGDNHLTVVTPRLGLLTLHVPGIATLQRDGQPVTFEDIRIGDRVTEGRYKLTPAYDDLLMEVISLSLESPSAIKVRGTVSAIDPSTGTFTVRSPEGTEVTLSISLTTEAEKDGVKGVNLANLEIGDIVVSAVYKPATGQLLRLTVLSADMRVLRGTIQSVDAPLSQVTVETDDQQVVLQIVQATAILKDGKEASLSDLSEKDRVMAAFYTADGTVSRLVVMSSNVINIQAQG